MEKGLEDLYNALKGTGYDDLIQSSQPTTLSYLLAPEGSNMRERPSLFMHPETVTRSYPQRNMNVGGFVASKHAPTTLFIGPEATPNTIAHEGAHTQQNMNPMTIKKKPVGDNIDELIKGQNISNEEGVGNDSFPTNMGFNMKELGATMQALEAELPAGQVVWDHPKIKGKFNGEEQRRIEQYMLSAYDKAKTPEYFEPIKSARHYSKKLDWMDIIQRNIRQWTAK